MDRRVTEVKEVPTGLPLIIVFVILLVGITGGLIFIVNSLQASTSDTGTQIAKRIEAPQNAATYASVQADVSNAVLAVQTYLAANPGADPGAAPLSPATASTTLTAVAAAGGFEITGTYTPTGYSYHYSSATGTFAVTNQGAALPTQGTRP